MLLFFISLNLSLNLLALFQQWWRINMQKMLLCKHSFYCSHNSTQNKTDKWLITVYIPSMISIQIRRFRLQKLLILDSLSLTFSAKRSWSRLELGLYCIGMKSKFNIICKCYLTWQLRWCNITNPCCCCWAVWGRTCRWIGRADRQPAPACTRPPSPPQTSSCQSPLGRWWWREPPQTLDWRQ